MVWRVPETLRSLVGHAVDRLARMTTPGFSEDAWFTRLPDETLQAERNERDYQDVVTRYEVLVESSRRRGDVAGAAAASWGRAHIEWHLRHTELALEFLAQGIASLPDASRLVVQVGGQLVARVAAACSRAQWRDTLRAPGLSSSPGVASLLQEALAAFSKREPSIAILLFSHVAAAQLTAGVPDQARATCETWLALRPRSENGDPYRGVAAIDLSTHTTAAERECWVHLVGTLALAIGRLEGFEAGLASLARAPELLGGLSVEEQFTLATSRGLLAFWDGRWSEAEIEYGSVLDGEPDKVIPGNLDHCALMGLGWSYRELGLLSEANGAAKSALEIHGSSIGTKALLAEVALLRGDLAAATDWATQTLAGICRPEPEPATITAASEASRVLAEVALARGQPDVALGHANAAVAFTRLSATDSDADLTRVLVTLGRSEAALDRPTAEQTFRAAIAVPLRADHPRRIEAQQALSRFLEARTRLPR